MQSFLHTFREAFRSGKEKKSFNLHYMQSFLHTPNGLTLSTQFGFGFNLHYMQSFLHTTIRMNLKLTDFCSFNLHYMQSFLHTKPRYFLSIFYYNVSICIICSPFFIRNRIIRLEMPISMFQSALYAVLSSYDLFLCTPEDERKVSICIICSPFFIRDSLTSIDMKEKVSICIICSPFFIPKQDLIDDYNRVSFNLHYMQSFLHTLPQIFNFIPITLHPLSDNLKLSTGVIPTFDNQYYRKPFKNNG